MAFATIDVAAFDVAIIGAGPAGIAAAANAARHNLTHVLFEKAELANTIFEYQKAKLVMAEPRKLPLRSLVPFQEGSRESILAVAQPVDTGALYFVATGDGGHHFSATLEEHNSAVQHYLQRLRYALKFLNYVPVLFISASTGKNVDKIFPLLEEVARERRKRIPTGEMNRFLKQVDFERASVPMSQRVKIYYMTQAAVAPPTFILFTDRVVKLHFAYKRFLENQIRDAFGFVGTPIWIKNRSRD